MPTMALVCVAGRERVGVTKYLAIWLKGWAAHVEGRKDDSALVWRNKGKARDELPHVA